MGRYSNPLCRAWLLQTKEFYRVWWHVQALSWGLGHVVVMEVILPHFGVRSFCVVVSEVLGSNLRARTDLALSTSIGDEDVEKESMLQFICVDMYFITDYGVFCSINAGLFKWNRIVYRPQHCGRWNHPTHVSSLQKGEECSDGGDSSALWGQTLLYSGIVFTLEWEVPGLNLRAGTDLALGTSMSPSSPRSGDWYQLITALPIVNKQNGSIFLILVTFGTIFINKMYKMKVSWVRIRSITLNFCLDIVSDLVPTARGPSPWAKPSDSVPGQWALGLTRPSKKYQWWIFSPSWYKANQLTPYLTLTKTTTIHGTMDVIW